MRIGNGVGRDAAEGLFDEAGDGSGAGAIDLGESNERSVVIVTTDRAGGEGLANACVRRGLPATVSAPRGKPPAGASTVVLDLTRRDADVVAYGVAVAPSAKLRVLALGERGDVLAPALTIDT